MSELQIEAELRTVSGKQVKQLRREGVVPAALHGVHEAVNIQVSLRPLTFVLRDMQPDSVIDLHLGGAVHQVRIGEIQRHITRGEVTHIDFLEVTA